MCLLLFIIHYYRQPDTSSQVQGIPTPRASKRETSQIWKFWKGKKTLYLCEPIRQRRTFYRSKLAKTTRIPRATLALILTSSTGLLDKFLDKVFCFTTIADQGDSIAHWLYLWRKGNQSRKRKNKDTVSKAIQCHLNPTSFHCYRVDRLEVQLRIIAKSPLTKEWYSPWTFLLLACW